MCGARSFTQRVVDAWNTLPLPEVMMEADLIVAFKSALEIHMNIQGMEGYESSTGR